MISIYAISVQLKACLIVLFEFTYDIVH